MTVSFTDFAPRPRCSRQRNIAVCIKLRSLPHLHDNGSSPCPAQMLWATAMARRQEGMHCWDADQRCCERRTVKRTDPQITRTSRAKTHACRARARCCCALLWRDAPPLARLASTTCDRCVQTSARRATCDLVIFEHATPTEARRENQNEAVRPRRREQQQRRRRHGWCCVQPARAAGYLRLDRRHPPSVRPVLPRECEDSHGPPAALQPHVADSR
jgi:hypothetical protein